MIKLKLFPSTKKEWIRSAIVWGSAFFTFLAIGYYMMVMPGTSYQGVLPSLSTEEQTLKLALDAHIFKLAEEIGARELEFSYEKLQQAEQYITEHFKSLGYEVKRQEFQVDKKTVANLEIEILGKTHPEEIFVIGAHYDSIPDTPGANDNGSGTAAVLELARLFVNKKTDHTVRLVAFVNEEPPYFQTPQMGSWVYAQDCKQKKEKIIGMISLETMGFYSQEKNTQNHPFPFSLYYPTTGNFIAFVGNISSRSLVHKTIRSFRSHTQFPSEGVAAPEAISGIGWSDHWSFWKAGYPAIMLTDTAPFRYKHYHMKDDLPSKIDTGALARIVLGVYRVIQEIDQKK